MMNPNSSPFGGAPFSPYTNTPLISSGVQPPGMDYGNNMILNMVLPLIAPNLMPPGTTLGSFSGSQNVIDIQKAMTYQREVMSAQAAAMDTANASFTEFWKGLEVLKKQRELTPAEIESINRSSKNVGGALAFAAPMLSQFAPGLMDIVDAMDMGGPAAAAQLMQTGLSQRDPVTGRIGWTPETITAMGRTFDNLFYGEKATMPDAMQGYGVGRLAQFIDVGQRAGIAPAAALSAATKEKLRAGVSIDTALTEEEKRRVGEAMPALEFGVAKGGADLDEAFRRVDAMKLGKYGSNMAGLMRAMEELFGPGKSVEQAVQIANALTQSGLSRMSLSNMESVIRRMDAVSSLTGINWQEMGALEQTAGNMVQASGGDPATIVGAGMYAAAAGKALSGYFQGTGTNRQEFMQRHAALIGAAASSQVGQQFAATARVGEQLKFKADSEGQAMMNAISEGRETYTYRGVTKPTYVRDDTEWARIMAGSTDAPGADRALLSRMRRDTELNAMFMPEKGALAAQRSQLGVDFMPHLQRQVMTMTGLGKARSDKLAGDIWKGITSFDWYDSSKNAGENFQAMTENIQAQLEAAGVKDANKVAIDIASRANRVAADANYGNLMGMAQHHGAMRAEQDDIIRRGDLQAELKRRTSAVGRGSWMKKLAEAIKTARPGTTFQDLVGEAIGAIDVETLNEEFDKVQKDIEDSGYTDADKKIMLDELKSQRDRANENVAKAKEEREADMAAAVRDMDKEGKIDMTAQDAKEEANKKNLADDPDKLAGAPTSLNISIAQLTINENGSATLTGEATSGQEGHQVTA